MASRWLTTGKTQIWFLCQLVRRLQIYIHKSDSEKSNEQYYIARRTWRDLDFVGLWSTAFVTIFGWQGVSSLLSMGLSVWQAIVCNFVAKLIQIAVVLSLGWFVTRILLRPE